jgi:HK97 gp10 family phage protein
VKTRVKGAAALRRKLRRMPDEFAVELKGAIAEGANEVLVEMQARAPVSPWWRTKEFGHLRDALSTSITLKGLRARIGLVRPRDRNLFFYARFLEYGTRKMRKRPFIYPAWLSRREAIRRNLQAASRTAFTRTANMRFSDV